MKCRYCPYEPATHYKDGREKAQYMREYWLRDHLEGKHKDKVGELRRKTRALKSEANQRERTLRLWER